MEAKNTCGNCEFFKPTGECHRFPPAADGPGIATWAACLEYDWCGEWKLKQAPDREP